MRQKILLILIALICQFSLAFAQTFTVGDLEFSVISEDEKTCEVCKWRGGQQTEAIIPEEIIYDGISYKVTGIGKEAFFRCSYLTTIKFPSTIQVIGQSAFWRCTGLDSLVIPSSVVSIAAKAFQDCSGIKELIIEDSREHLKVGSYVFDGVKMERAYVGRFITYTGLIDPIFRGKSSLKEITIGDNITLIEPRAFFGCSNLSSVKLPKFLSSIGISAFESCGLTELTIDFVSNISEYAFRNTRLENLTIHRIGRIDDFAFSECYGLKTLTIGDDNDGSIIYFGESVFYMANNIESLYLGAQFDYTSAESPFGKINSLKKLTIGPKVSKLPAKAFEECIEISEIESCPITPPVIFKNSFSYSTYKNAFLNIPEGSYESYKNDSVWCNFSIFDQTIPVVSIELNPSSIEAIEGESLQLTATVLPEDATDKTLEWSSSDDEIATVDETGLVSILKEGSCIITARTTDGSDLSAECHISITTGVEEIAFDESDIVDVYTLDGVKIKSDCKRNKLDDLTSGIYLLRKGNKVEKLIIR